jgi:hypothetical protein
MPRRFNAENSPYPEDFFTVVATRLLNCLGMCPYRAGTWPALFAVT